MAKAPGIDAQLERLAALRAQHLDGNFVTELRRALQSSHGIIVAKAASIVALKRVRELEGEMVGAFERLLAGGVAADKGCAAKIALARALDQMEVDCTGAFLAAVRCVQLEGSFGGATDTAVELRGIGAGALVRCRFREVMDELVRLLVDPNVAARIAAVRAIAYDGREAAEVLLRYKALAGDAEPEVVAECFAGLLRIAPAKSVPFVEGFLDHAHEEIRESSALALGASRQPAALEVLRQRCAATVRADEKRLYLLAIAQVRSEPAIEFLLARLVGDPKPSALDALEALAMYRHDANVRDRVERAVQERGDPAVREAHARQFRT